MLRSPLKKWAVIGTASVAFYSLVTSTALALFLPRATLQNIAFQTARLELKVSGHQVDFPDPGSFAAAANFSGTNRLIPGGQTVKEDFWVRNSSTSDQLLRLSGQLTAGNQDWVVLKEVIEAKLRSYADPEDSGWRSLAEWSAAPIDFPGRPVGDSTQKRYEFEYRLRETYPVDPDGSGPLEVGSPIGAELADRGTSGLKFIIDGRQE